MTTIKVNYIAVGLTVAVVLLLMLRMNYVKRTEVQTVNLKELLSVCIEAAEFGGKQVAEVKQMHKALKEQSKGQTDEGVNEMKTEGDMQSHRAILTALEKVFPFLSDRIVSEEQEESKTKVVVDVPTPSKSRHELAELKDEQVLSSDVTIWVDPLDATKEYTEDLNEYVTTMVCVAVKGKPVIGVIHRPMKSKVYDAETVWAWVGNGVSSNIDKAADEGLPDNPDVIISRSHAGKAKEVLSDAFSGYKGKVIEAGGAGYKTIEVIRGKADLYAHVTKIKKWDICSGNAILNSVGGKMLTLKNEEIDYDKQGTPENKDGLLASLYNIDEYMKKLAPVFSKS